MAGALAVLIAVMLSLSLVGAPGGEEVDTDASSVLVSREKRSHARVTRTDAGANPTAAVYSQGVRRRTADLTARRQRPRVRIDQPRPDGISLGIDRQRTAMRAALLLLVASDGAKIRAR
jgi:hypothetical protein